MMRRLVVMAVGIVVLGLVGGCATMPRPFAPSALPVVPPAARMSPPKPAPGSLFVASGADLFSDLRAHRVGDIITVEIVENSKARKKNDTKAQRSNTFQAGIKELLGMQGQFPGQSTSPMVKADFTSKHDAKAELTKEDTMTASITCMVVEVLPNGNLVIRGSREVQVNGETEYIVLQGIVRPSDVSADNTVYSTQVAEAKIYYTGRGVLTDKQTPGWLARLLDHIWPF